MLMPTSACTSYPAWSISVTVAPASEPVTLTEAKLHLRVETSVTTEDNWITASIQAAREVVETVTNRALISQTVVLKLQRFPSGIPIWLPRPPLISISSVAYIDANGTSQPWAATTGYDLAQPSGPKATYARIYPAYGTQYPQTRDQMEAVTITYLAGYANAAAVPQGIKNAMLLLIGHWYANREAVNVGNITTELPLGVASLLGPFMVTQW